MGLQVTTEQATSYGGRTRARAAHPQNKQFNPLVGYTTQCSKSALPPRYTAAVSICFTLFVHYMPAMTGLQTKLEDGTNRSPTWRYAVNHLH
jgi:hypothetical protein